VGAAIGLWLIGGRAIELFLGGEAFDAEDVATTSLLLGVFALSVPLESLNQLLARAVYSTHDTILPVLASLAALSVTVASVNVLADSEGIVALPLGFAIGQGTRLVLLIIALALRLPTVGRPGPGSPPSGSAGPDPRSAAPPPSTAEDPADQSTAGPVAHAPRWPMRPSGATERMDAASARSSWADLQW
jgi:hypothetical protein